ncbi:hypothetical protein [Pedobacter antarcticus]|uniref:hypothetical protein n=1 Tax=Pedobacter antarcticus TaxID=34086 RepID=UPI001C58B93B|nr:hypothetical protein [Pedobacter antarcticus]
MKYKILFFAIIIISSLTSKNLEGQTKKNIYYVVDTISTTVNNRISELGTEGSLKYISFYCKCLPPYNRNLTFVYDPGKQNVQIIKEISYLTLSWKELQELVVKAGAEFKYQYNLTILEVLPDKTYRSANVRLVIYPQTTVDFEKLKFSKDSSDPLLLEFEL